MLDCYICVKTSVLEKRVVDAKLLPFFSRLASIFSSFFVKQRISAFPKMSNFFPQHYKRYAACRRPPWNICLSESGVDVLIVCKSAERAVTETSESTETSQNKSLVPSNTFFSIGGIVQTFFFFGSRRRDDDITWRRDHWWTPECTYSSFSLQLLSCLMFCCFFQKFSFDDTQLAFGFVKCLWTFYFLDRWITVCLRVFLSDEEIVLDLSVEPVDG